MFVAEDEHAIIFKTSIVLFVYKRVLSSIIMDESVLDHTARFKRYTLQSRESYESNPSNKELIEFEKKSQNLFCARYTRVKVLHTRSA